jgi:hypothetical protein
MGIYLGNVGSIEITRKSLGEEKFSVVNPSDVNASKNRFSFDFEEGTLITGDFVEITATDATNLDFVTAAGWANGIVQSSGNWYVFIDDMGGIKLYNNFDDSLAGEATGVISLAAIARDIPIRVVVRDRNSRLLGCIVDYELNTNRETVDITALSDQYRQQYSALITGSGSLTAQWDYLSAGGDETVHYLMQLVLRTEIGSGFRAKMYIKSQNTAAAGGSYSASQFNDSLWWEFDAIATSSATNFAPGNIIVTRIDFVATGPIKLRAKTITPNYLLQESGGKIALDQDPSSYLLLDEAE